MKDLMPRVRAAATEVVEMRHALHRIPEVHGEEHRTSELLRARLEGRGLEVRPPMIGTDVVAILRGGGPGKNVTLRADIDALPVDDASGAPWRSTRDGFSHACGHDGHMAILMGTIDVLRGLRDSLAGSVRFVFQPAEEEIGGGKAMVRQGLLEQEPKANAAFALHGWPGLRLGSLSATPGPMMAAADRFVLRVTGKGTHGARPHAGVDPVVTAAQLVLALQTIVSRTVDPMKQVVLSVCTIHGGRTSNVIPEEVVMEGTTRYFDADLKAVFQSRMEEIAAGVCAAAGASHRLDYEEGYMPLVNDAGMVDFARKTVRARLGPEAWIDGLPPSMGAEDFSYYLERVPGAMMRLGLGEGSPNLHNPHFDFDDRAVEPGIAALSALAVEYLAAAHG
jgi:hippurate hydrolase